MSGAGRGLVHKGVLQTAYASHLQLSPAVQNADVQGAPTNNLGGGQAATGLHRRRNGYPATRIAFFRIRVASHVDLHTMSVVSVLPRTCSFCPLTPFPFPPSSTARCFACKKQRGGPQQSSALCRCVTPSPTTTKSPCGSSAPQLRPLPQPWPPLLPPQSRPLGFSRLSRQTMQPGATRTCCSTFGTWPKHWKHYRPTTRRGLSHWRSSDGFGQPMRPSTTMAMFLSHIRTRSQYE